MAAVIAASAPGAGAMAGAIRSPPPWWRWTNHAHRHAQERQGKIVGGGAAEWNFDQIRVGDLVTVEYMRALTLELKGPGSVRSGSADLHRARACRPVAGGAAGRQVVIMANVTAVNTKEGYVTLRGPKGNSVDVSVPDPAQLKRVKVGDQVEAVYTEAVAVTVNHAAKPTKP